MFSWAAPHQVSAAYAYTVSYLVSVSSRSRRVCLRSLATLPRSLAFLKLHVPHDEGCKGGGGPCFLNFHWQEFDQLYSDFSRET